MRFLRAGFLSLTLFASCNYPERVNYSHHLESDYKDPLPGLLEKKKEMLYEIDFEEYLEETAEYFTALNSGGIILDMDEFHERLEPLNNYLEIMSNQLYSVDNVFITDKEEIVPKEYIGINNIYSNKIYLKEKHLSIPLYVHEFGHNTDLKNNALCDLPRLTGLELCDNYETHRLRNEMVADAFLLYIAYSLKETDWDIAGSMAWRVVPIYDNHDDSKTVEDLLQKVETIPSYYRTEGKMIAVLNKYKFQNARGTWNYIRSHSKKEIFKTLEKIVKEKGELGKLITVGLDDIGDYFW